MNENRGMKNMDQTSNNQNESDEIKMSRGSVDANEGSLGSGKKKSRFGIGVLVGIVIGAVIITGVWGAAKVVSAVFFKGNFAYFFYCICCYPFASIVPSKPVT